jgi:GH25 family lysozyme M1 (1,4-beta-N-acetylmuramidase)
MIYSGDPNYTCRFGIDISRHEGEIDWKKVKESGVEFVFIRIGYRGYQTGILHLDENFHQNIKGALEQNLDIGVYVFSQAINEEEALEEAELVIKELENYKITLPVVFDPESISWEEARTDDISGEQFTKNTIAFCNRVKEAGYDPMIYSNLIWETEFFDLSQLSEYKIWFADYEKKPQSPYHFEFWQYEGEGIKVPGINRKVDADIQLIPVKQ